MRHSIVLLGLLIGQQRPCRADAFTFLRSAFSNHHHSGRSSSTSQLQDSLGDNLNNSTGLESESATSDASLGEIAVSVPPKLLKNAATSRRLDLMWCQEDYCKDAVRERVVGINNQIYLNGPATGQVAYHWTSREEGDAQSASAKDHSLHQQQAPPTVLLLIRPGDDDLLQKAAEAVKQLTADDSNVRVLLDPSTAARLKYYHGVGDDHICLFEVSPTPGYGSELASNDARLNVKPKLAAGKGDLHKLVPNTDYMPDLICTLGGDGLLMHASMIFQGPVPPILCVSGGSLGFLTPFRPEEMVDAIKVALGLVTQDDECNVVGGNTVLKTYRDLGDNVYPPNMPSYPYEPLLKAPVATGQVQDDGSALSRFSFGRGGRICLSIRMRLECTVISREGTVRARYNVLNEVVVDRGSSPYLAALECFCDDAHLTTVQADGVIFATPTGSTAYSLAAGSSVVHPAVPCILVTPICPHVLSFRSMVFPDHVVLRCYVPDDARAVASVAFDGKHRQELARGDSVQIRMSCYPVPTINRDDHSSDWLGSLKRNFNFNSRARQQPL